MKKRTLCPSIGLEAVYHPRQVHPHCPICNADLSVQGKHQKVRAGVIIKRHYTDGD